MNPLRQTSLVLLGLLLAAGTAQAAAPFVDNGDGTVTDTSTGLMWDQCPLGRSGADCATGTAGAYDWAGAFGAAGTMSAANHKGHSDWRLPSIAELMTLVRGLSPPTIDTQVFPNTPISAVWSSSRDANASNSAWHLHFNSGNAVSNHRDLPDQVRLVRGGQYLGAFGLAPVGLLGVTTTSATLTSTSPVTTTGYWVVVLRGATPPSAAQIRAGVAYGTVTPAAHGNGAMTAKTPASFPVAGLLAATDYDLYAVAEQNAEVFSQIVGPLPFRTLANGAVHLLIDPATPTTLYASLDGAGAYKKTATTDWTPIHAGLSGGPVKAMALGGGVLYAATQGGGVFKRANEGASWTPCAALGNPYLLSLALDATGTLYAGTEGGVYVSNDACATWTAMNNGLPN